MNGMTRSGIGKWGVGGLADADRAARRRGLKATRARRPRRGVATMLVVTGTAAAVVIAAAYVVSRQNAPQVGQNLASGTQARFAAETGIDLAEAVMNDPNLDWRTDHVNGVLIDEYDFGGGTLTVTLVDTLTGQPPTATTEYATMTATGQSADGLAQVAEADIHQPVVSTDVDVDLSEFAIFATDGIAIRNESIVGRWDQSARSIAGEPVRLGTNATRAGAVSLDSAGVIDGEVYVRQDASASVVAQSGDVTGRLKRVNVTKTENLPIPAAPGVNVLLLPAPANQNPVLTHAWTVAGSNRFTTVTIRAGGELRWGSDDRITHITGDLVVENGGKIVADKRATVVVGGNVTIRDDASVEIRDGGALNLHVGGNLLIDGAVVGLPIADAGAYNLRNAAKGTNVYLHPERWKCYKRAGSAAGTTWRITDKSFAAGMFYGRDCNLQVDGGSALFGHAMGRNVEVTGRSMVFYDHALDKGRGYSNPGSPLFSALGVLQPTLKLQITSLDTLVLNTVNSLAALLTPAAPEEPIDCRLCRVGLEPARDGDNDEADDEAEVND